MTEPATPPSRDVITWIKSWWNLQPVLVPLYALLLSFIVGGVLIAAVGVNPFEAYWALLRGAFGSPERIAGSIARSVPFIGSALALAFAFRAGLFNIGAEGQLLIGGVTAAWVGTWSFMYDIPSILAVPIIIARRIRRWCPVGRDPGRPAGAHGRPRGDHDDHAEQHRPVPDALAGELERSGDPSRHGGERAPDEADRGVGPAHRARRQ